MKPIIIYKQINEHNEIVIKKDELERLINEAYEQGVADGVMCYPYLPYSTPIIPTYPKPMRITW